MRTPIPLARLAILIATLLISGAATGCGQSEPAADQSTSARVLPVPPDARYVDGSPVPDDDGATVRLTGEVRDELNRPVAAADIEVAGQDPVGERLRIAARTGRDGTFAATLPPLRHLVVTASHPDFGSQWTDVGDLGQQPPFMWTGDVAPATPVTLVIRRGVILRGRALDERGGPFAHDSVFLVPAYNGSGPPRVEANTDADGRFAFPRLVLRRFELVPHSLAEWRPATAGTHLRFKNQDPEAWRSTAEAGGEIAIQVERYTTK